MVEKAVGAEKAEKAEKPEESKKAEKPAKADKKAQAKEQKAPEITHKRKDLPADFKYIVRMVNTDINGEYSVLIGLTHIRGMGLRAAQAVAQMAGIDQKGMIGSLTDQQVVKLEETVASYVELVPGWMVNRQNDWETGDDLHLVGTDIDVFLKDDINRMRMIRCYKGIRHERGQKVRGQRTRSNGRTGLQMGVIRQKLAPAAAGEKTEKAEKPAKVEKKE